LLTCFYSRYNLKRRVASLPPLSSEIFAEKVLANKASAAATVAKASYERLCEACNKTYLSENAFINHIGSQKHKANVVKNERSRHDDDVNSVLSSTFLPGGTSEKAEIASTIDEDAGEEFSKIVNGIKKASLQDKEPISRRPTRPHHSAVHEERPPHPLSPGISRSTTHASANGEIPKETALRQCFFCAANANNLEENLSHMQKVHGMFIPERPYIVDLEGLIIYLSKKVHDEYQCLYCGRLKWSEDGIKTHMRDMSHCKIAYDTEEQQLDIGEFYDFRSTYSDGFETDEDEDVDEVGPAKGGGVKLGAKPDVKTSGNGDDTEMADGDDSGWETDSTDSSVPSEEIGAMYYDDDRHRVQTKLHRRNTDSKRHRSADGFHSHARPQPRAAYHDDFELHLPTGRIAGHRSLNKYFRQNLRNYPTPEERAQRLLTAGDENDHEALPNGDGQERGRARTSRQLISRADGGLGMLAVTDEKKRQVKATEKRERKREARLHAKHQWRTDLKGNSQKHYRVGHAVNA
jgi:pre-60S factor REI1